MNRQSKKFEKLRTKKNIRKDLVVNNTLTQNEKEILAKLVPDAFKNAAKAMYETSGFNVYSNGKVIIKKYRDGREEEIGTLTSQKRPKKLVLV